MKTLILLAALQFSAITPTQPPIEESFDAFTELLHAALSTGDPDIYSMFFDDEVLYLQSGVIDTLSSEQLIARLNDFGRPDELLTHLARGFLRNDEGDTPTFLSLHNSAPGHHHIRIRGSSVRFRKLPGQKGEVIALLNTGLYTGQTDAKNPMFCDAKSGIEWMHLEINHPKVGLIKGYIAADYVELISRESPKAIKVQQKNGRWVITELSAL